MCPRERFPLYKSLSRLVLSYKKDWATLLHFIYFCYLLLVTNYPITKLSVTYSFSACRELLGNVVISKKFLRTRKIMVMHSNERGECCPRTLVDRQRKRYHNAVDVVVRLHDPTDQVPNARHLRVLHTFSSMTSLELRSSRVLRESFVSTTAW